MSQAVIQSELVNLISAPPPPAQTAAVAAGVVGVIRRVVLFTISTQGNPAVPADGLYTAEFL